MQFDVDATVAHIEQLKEFGPCIQNSTSTDRDNSPTSDIGTNNSSLVSPSSESGRYVLTLFTRERCYRII